MNKLTGPEILGQPLLNKDAAFTERQREELGLRGLLPWRVATIEEQVALELEHLRRKSDDVESVVKEMAARTRSPIIFPLSNPTSKSEAVPADVLRWTGGQALIATGSPFGPVDIAGTTRQVGQANNVFIFPGVGLGAIVAQAREVTDSMFLAAADTLASLVTSDRLSAGALYPRLADLRDVSRAIAIAVARQASECGVADRQVHEDVTAAVDAAMWTPDYPRPSPSGAAPQQGSFSRAQDADDAPGLGRGAEKGGTMTTTQATQPAVRVEITGKVPVGMAELAVTKIGSVLRHAAEPVLFARLRLTMAADPAVDKPAVATINVDMNGRFVRAQAAAESMRGAIEQVAKRLRVRLDRARRDWAALRGTRPVNEPGEWRHQSIPAHRPPYFPRPAAERSVICQVSRASGRMLVVDAAAELELLDYDFFLFTEASTGTDAIIYRSGDGYLLVLAAPRYPTSPFPVPRSVRVSDQPAPTLLAADAITRLESLGDQFMFYLDAESRRGNVVYHRHDGHYGLVEAGAEQYRALHRR